MTTLGTLYQTLRKHLRGAGIESADIDARLLLAHAFGGAPDDVLLKPDTPVSPDHAGLKDAVARRMAAEPVSKITGHREFYGLDFIVNADVLDPRPDSETLIDAARAFLQARQSTEQPPHILDICTGSGCLVITLLTLFPEATATATDISLQALAVARQNAVRHGVAGRIAWVNTSYIDAVREECDVIVCNPPYIRSGDIAQLEAEVQLHDPMLALDGGEDGMTPYKILFPQIRTIMKNDARAFFEIGFDQAHDIKKMAAACGLTAHGTQADLGGHERVVEVG